MERLTEESIRDWNHFKELLSACEGQSSYCIHPTPPPPPRCSRERLGLNLRPHGGRGDMEAYRLIGSHAPEFNVTFTSKLVTAYSSILVILQLRDK